MFSSCSSGSGAEVVPKSRGSLRDGKHSTPSLYKAWHDGREAVALALGPWPWLWGCPKLRGPRMVGALSGMCMAQDQPPSHQDPLMDIRAQNSSLCSPQGMSPPWKARVEAVSPCSLALPQLFHAAEAVPAAPELSSVLDSQP